MFTSANWNVPQTVTVTGLSDGILDGNVSYTIELGPTTSVGPELQRPAEQQSVAVTNYDSAPVDKIGICPRPAAALALDTFNDGVYTAGLDRQYLTAGRRQDHRRRLGRRRVRRHRPVPRRYRHLPALRGRQPVPDCDDARRQGRRHAAGRQLGRPAPAMRSASIRRGDRYFHARHRRRWGVQDADDRVGSARRPGRDGKPLVGDWDGDRRRRGRPLSSGGRGSSRSTCDRDLVSLDADDIVMTQLAGRVGGQALVGDWDGDGRRQRGSVLHVLNGQWFLDTNYEATTAEITFTPPGWRGGRQGGGGRLRRRRRHRLRPLPRGSVAGRSTSTTTAPSISALISSSRSSTARLAELRWWANGSCLDRPSPAYSRRAS